MGCHDKRKNFHGTPLCLTGAEYAKGETFINCQACHMPIVKVPKLEKGEVIPGEFVSIADHSMGGGHDGKMVTRGLAMSMQTEKQGDVIKARLTQGAVEKLQGSSYQRRSEVCLLVYHRGCGEAQTHLAALRYRGSQGFAAGSQRDTGARI